MKNLHLLVKATMVVAIATGLLAHSRSSSVLYCARPVTEGPGVCELGMDDAAVAATPHYVYLATGNECSQPCTDSTAIRSVSFKPFK